MTDLETVTPDGVDIVVHELGGHGPLGLLVHANGFHGTSLAELARPLAATLECWAPDLRGHGRSASPEGLDFAWDGFASDVLAALDALDTPPSARRPVGVGHSLGATALLLAEAARPGTFAALYAFEPVVFPPGTGPDPSTPFPLAEAARRRRDRFADVDEAFERLSSTRLFSHFDTQVLRRYVEDGFEDAGGARQLRCRPENEARVFEAGLVSGAFERLAAVACPTAIAFGTTSEVVDAARAETLASALPRGAVLPLEGSGHLAPLEAPREVAASILGFLASLDR